jgi:hypothetical protein
MKNPILPRIPGAKVSDFWKLWPFISPWSVSEINSNSRATEKGLGGSSFPGVL